MNSKVEESDGSGREDGWEGGEEFSREAKSCAIHHLCSSGGYVLFYRSADAKENKW